MINLWAWGGIFSLFRFALFTHLASCYCLFTFTHSIVLITNIMNSLEKIMFIFRLHFMNTIYSFRLISQWICCCLLLHHEMNFDAFYARFLCATATGCRAFEYKWLALSRWIIHRDYSRKFVPSRLKMKYLLRSRVDLWCGCHYDTLMHSPREFLTYATWFIL